MSYGVGLSLSNGSIVYSNKKAASVSDAAAAVMGMSALSVSAPPAVSYCMPWLLLQSRDPWEKVKEDTFWLLISERFTPCLVGPVDI